MSRRLVVRRTARAEFDSAVDWYEQSRAAEHKEKAREYLQKFVSSGGGKDGGLGYVKAASDKLYALSGT